MQSTNKNTMSLKFAISKNGQDDLRDEIGLAIAQIFINEGHRQVMPEEELNFVINYTKLNDEEHYFRKSRNEWIVSLFHLPAVLPDMKSVCYNVLIRTLSNLAISIVPMNDGDGRYMIYCVTPEVGFYRFPYDPVRLYECMMPIVSSHILLNNQVFNNLPPAYWDTTPVVDSIKVHGKILDKMGLLPTPFPIESILNKQELEHIYSFFQIKGISYGNLSAREYIPEIGKNTFWMTARGVNKGNLELIGQDILLVSGYDRKKQAINVHFPTHVNSRARVSVDAIEHQLIYEKFPEVKAIVHVHGWVNNIESTFQNYPCGTIELAEAVVDMIKKSRNPGAAVIGLKNHGITVTGKSLEDIFSRLEGKIMANVPMYE